MKDQILVDVLIVGIEQLNLVDYGPLEIDLENNMKRNVWLNLDLMSS